jgi:transcriptional regulator with XRE-family HTH domain
MTTHGNGSAFGSYLKKLREKKKLKLNEVAIDLKIDPTLLSKYEGGTRFPKKEKLDRIATYFKVSKNEMARKISIDKQKTHYERLASENETKIKETKTS